MTIPLSKLSLVWRQPRRRDPRRRAGARRPDGLGSRAGRGPSLQLGRLRARAGRSGPCGGHRRGPRRRSGRSARACLGRALGRPDRGPAATARRTRRGRRHRRPVRGRGARRPAGGAGHRRGAARSGARHPGTRVPGTGGGRNLAAVLAVRLWPGSRPRRARGRLHEPGAGRRRRHRVARLRGHGRRRTGRRSHRGGRRDRPEHPASERFQGPTARRGRRPVGYEQDGPGLTAARTQSRTQPLLACASS
jgi:hypothetical protein